MMNDTLKLKIAIKALEIMADEEMIRVGVDQTDIDVQPTLSPDEVVKLAKNTLMLIT